MMFSFRNLLLLIVGLGTFIVINVIMLGLFLGLCYLRHKPTSSSKKRAPAGKPSAQVLVLGDIGRSPRMQYHALSIAKHGGTVQLIGYLESDLIPDLGGHPNVRVFALPLPPAWFKKLPFALAGPLKVTFQIIFLSWTLLYSTDPSQWLIVQNPPSIPTLAVAGLACFLRHTALVIDWHNYGWTILAGTRGHDHPFVGISKKYECLAGQYLPTLNLTVTDAMKEQLQRPPYNIRTPIHAMHDRPAGIFKFVSTYRQRKILLDAVPTTADLAQDILVGKLRLLVSSTSWTPDEDFSILLDALVQYGVSPKRVPLLVIITGRGPQKAMYEAKIASLRDSGRLPNIEIRTAFLSFENYAKLLAASDLGICLHMSSSGVDLPMKVVDMFGAGLPVLAYSNYPSFDELVKEGKNGIGFENSDELSEALVRVLDPLKYGEELATLKRGAIIEGNFRWDDEWNQTVKPLLGFRCI